MSTLVAYGISSEIPAGWEGYAFRHEGGEPTVHIASFRLPGSDGEFGSRATAAMPADGLFLALTEYQVAADQLGAGIFAAPPPGGVRFEELSPHTLLRPLTGQRGLQRFFSSGGRAFCLYVVAGREGDRLLRAANGMLATIEIEPRL